MRKSRMLAVSLVLSSVFCIALPQALTARQHADSNKSNLVSARSKDRRFGLPPAPYTGGIKEEIPDKYKERYLEWKNEFLSTDTGRSQWSAYEQNQHLVITITISCKDKYGAGTGKYKWSDSGELVSATINLGCRIDEGYPSPIYWPVVYSLAPDDTWFFVSRNILAAAKIAHEFGHIKQASTTDSAMYQLQNQLIPTYNKILLSNGHNQDDPRLLELAKKMGGIPVQIWENREYWGEVNAMRFLRERIVKESDKRTLFAKITRTVDMYAKGYADRFDQVAKQ
jgi:hypothetical protein